MNTRTRITGMYLLTATIALSSLFCAVQAGAEHFDIVLQAEGDGQKASAGTDTTPPVGGVNPRPALHVKVGDRVKITWRMASGFPHGLMKGVTTHFFIVREATAGQKPVPDPAGPNGVINNSFTMDYAPKAVAAGSVQLKAPEAGTYLVRIQSEDTHLEHDHEHFSALDLIVE